MSDGATSRRTGCTDVSVFLGHSSRPGGGGTGSVGVGNTATGGEWWTVAWSVTLVVLLVAVTVVRVDTQTVSDRLGRLFAATNAPTAQLTSRPDAAVLRERLVRLDHDVLAAARRNAGRADVPPAVLRLDLFNDVVLHAIVERTGPTSAGYWLSGRIEEWAVGSITLVANDDVIAGTVRAPSGTYTILSVGDGVHAIRQLDSAILLTFEEDTLPPVFTPFEDSAVQPASGPQAGSGRVGPIRPAAQIPPAEPQPEEDGSRIDVMVVYTPAARDAQGGRREIEAVIELWVAETNQAYADSGVIQRLNLVLASMVDYEEAGPEESTRQGVLEITVDLHRLNNANDGHLDEVIDLMDRYAADIVTLVGHYSDENGGTAGGYCPETARAAPRRGYEFGACANVVNHTVGGAYLGHCPKLVVHLRVFGHTGGVKRDIELEATLVAKYAAVAPVLDERSRRRWAAAESLAIGYGGDAVVSSATGLARGTIRKGRREISRDEAPTDRIRRPGGGRPRIQQDQPGIQAALEALVDPLTRGDPTSPLRWTCKSRAKLAAALSEQGWRVSSTTVGRLLHRLGYRLQSPRKRQEGATHPDRNAQFEHINQTADEHLRAGQPVISVDTKKKELVGNFKNGGREWQPKGTPPPVLVHDFPTDAEGKAIPYGVYDMARNEAWVSVGWDHDTPAFAVASIRQWWHQMGCGAYPEATTLFITADAGGSNGYRSRAWKHELQQLADETGLTIEVSHFPPGTSKWNKIEHRLFCHITANWRGTPLTTYETIVDRIGNVRTATGLQVRAELDVGEYPTGVTVTKEQMDALALVPDEFHGEWNYKLLPRSS